MISSLQFRFDQHPLVVMAKLFARCDEVMGVLQRQFRPEFLNRIDEIVVLHPLSREDLREIVKIQLMRVEGLLRECGLRLEMTPSALDYLAEVGWDPDYGARPLIRATQREVQDPLALKVLGGALHSGETIRVKRDTDGLKFIS